MLKVTPVIQAWEVNKNKKIKPTVYNTYKLLTNAGFYSKAELLRSFFLHETKIDLAKEPIRA
jgi:Fe2+ or Zn2+ uptake regulation protein